MIKFYQKIKTEITNRTQPEIVLLTLSALAVICVSPFIFFRLIKHDWSVALLDATVSLVMISFFIFVYKTRKVDVARIYMSIFIMGAIFIDIVIKGPTALYWYYPCVIAVYYLTSYMMAFSICIVSIILLMIVIFPAVPNIEFFTIFVTSSLLNLFALLMFRSNQKSEAQLKKLATIDSLTQAGNRRAFKDHLAQLLNKHQRKQYPLCLIIVDLDHFKSVNDQYGHLAGDKVLVEVSQLMTDNTRSFEHLYRYGGEEFIIMPLQMNLQDANLVAEKLRKLVEDHTFTDDIKLTISLGIAQYQVNELEQKWISRADSALYKAKQSGRNRVMLAQP